MADTKIIIANIKESTTFYNVETNEGKNIGIPKDKNPVLVKQLAAAKPGDELIINLWEKEGDDGKGGKVLKSYGYDPKGNGSSKGGGKSFPAKDKSFEAGLAAAQAAATAISLKKDLTLADFDTYFEHIHSKITSKITK